MKTAFAWILGLGTIVGAVLIWLSRRNPIDNLKDALEVQKLREQIAQDTAKVEELKGQGDDARVQREMFQAEIEESKRAALLIASETPSRIYEKTNAEIAEEWTRLGF